MSLASGRVTVRYDEKRMWPQQLEAVVINTGFGASGVNATVAGGSYARRANALDQAKEVSLMMGAGKVSKQSGFRSGYMFWTTVPRSSIPVLEKH